MPDPNGAPRPSVVMLHGFTQTGACLGPLADVLALDSCVLRPDLPGHGAAADLASLDLPGAAEHLRSAIAPTLDGPAVWFGYSMGARVALQVAVDHPEVVSGLVLVGGTPGIADEAERAERRHRDDRLADRIVEIGVDAFLREWLAGPLFERLPDRARFDSERRSNTAEGLAGSLRHAGTGSMSPLWDRLPEIDVPVLLVTGSGDVKFTGIARDMAALLPDAEVVVLSGAGHAAHLEDPGPAADAIVPFCAALAPSGSGRWHGPAERWYRSGDAPSGT